MSTRSYIGITLPNGRVKAIYCHFDGYIVNGVGETLLNHYKDEQAVQDLIALGSLRSLYASLTSTVAYHRDRGDPWDKCTPGHWESQTEYLTLGRSVDYLYLFDPGTETWSVSVGVGGFQDLGDAYNDLVESDSN